MRHATWLLGSVALLTMATAAAAQTTSPDRPADASAESSAGSTPPAADEAAQAADDSAGDIIVTAQRRPERLQNVPISVTVVSGDALKTRGINDLAQIALAAPSLQASTDNGFAVRGVGTQAFSSSIESSVAFALDEVNLTNPGLLTDLFDVSQVELLNGPQGLLFGRNASAGLLNVTTTRPELGVLGASFDLEVDHRDTAPDNSSGVIARPNINVPIGDKVALRLSGYYNYQEPLVRFLGREANRTEINLRRFAGRAKLLVEPTDQLSIYLIGDYGEEHGILGSFDSLYRALGPGSVNAGPLASVGIVASEENTDLAGEGGYYRDIERRGLQGKVSYLLGTGVEISNIAAWKSFDRNQQLDVDGTPQNGANTNTSTTGFDQFSNEFRVALPADARLSGQAGLYYFHSTLDVEAQIGGNNYFPAFLLPRFPFCVGAVAVPGAPPPTCSRSNNFFLGNDRVVHQTNDSYAAFGQLTYKVTPELQLIAGARVTHDRLSIDLTQNNNRYFQTLGIPFTGSEEYDNTNLSWKVGAQYNFSRNAMIYANYGRGYKGPGFNDNATSPTGSLVVRPETNENIEIGAKTSWLDRRLVFNVSLFRSIFDDYQIQSFDLATTSFIIQNAAKLRTQGAEATLIARPVEGLTLNASATLLDSEFESFPGAQCFPTQGCVTFDAAGRRPPLSPKFTSTIQGIYEFQTAGEARPFVEANYYHRSSIDFGIAPAPGTRLGATDILGGSIGVRGDRWRVALFCKNCTDERVPVSIGTEAGDANARDAAGRPNPVTSYRHRFGVNSFRTVGLLLGFNF
jgi:iron complex outermembrane recepter protein